MEKLEEPAMVPSATISPVFRSNRLMVLPMYVTISPSTRMGEPGAEDQPEPYRAAHSSSASSGS